MESKIDETVKEKSRERDIPGQIRYMLCQEYTTLQNYEKQLDEQIAKFYSTKIIYSEKYEYSIRRVNKPLVDNNLKAAKQPTNITMSLVFDFNKIKPETSAVTSYAQQYRKAREENQNAKNALDAIQHVYLNNVEAKKEYERRLAMIKKKAEDVLRDNERIDDCANKFFTIETF